MGWTCGEYSFGRRQASACLNRISTKVARRMAAAASSVQRVLSGWRNGIEAKKRDGAPSCDKFQRRDPLADRNKFQEHQQL